MSLRLRPLVVVVLVVLAAIIALLWFGQRRLIYFPDPTAPRPPADVREVTLQTADDLRLTAWLVAPTGTDRGVAVLVAPGNAGNRGDRMVLARGMAIAGLTVLLLDYRGYAGNPGRPSEDGLAHDARAGLAYLEGAGLGANGIVYFGESLGAGVVAGLARDVAPAGLVLRSPFIDLPSVGSHHYPVLPVRLLLRDRFPVADNLAHITAPTVVIYGSKDSVVPAEQSRAVADRAAGIVNVVIVDGADHNDPTLTHGRPVIDAVVSLVNRIGQLD